MRGIALSAIFLSSAAGVARASFFHLGNNPATLSDKSLHVPGDNPLYYCRNSSDFSLVIERVDLSPNPPKPGTALSIKADGTFAKKVEKGAYVNLSVKYGLITLLKQTADLCEQIEQVDEECPLEGATTIRKDVDIPKEVPPGKYSVLADVYTKDDERVICLQAEVRF